LSESFAVVGNRKHTLAARNGVNFGGVFPIFGYQTLFSPQTFGATWCFWEMTGRMME
jgi:hypothetical protein